MTSATNTTRLDLWGRYRLRLRRRRLLWRAIRARHVLTECINRTEQIGAGQFLCFATVRNEMTRLPWFLEHHRRLGVDHFLFVVNGGEDDTAGFLQRQSDCSVWETNAGYKAARFGMDWLTWLLFRFGHDHWCLTLDADECLIYPHWETRPLLALTQQLEAAGAEMMAALMLDLYPKGQVGAGSYETGMPPESTLGWFDPGGYRRARLGKYDAMSIRGGARERVFFQGRPELSPHLHKTPLIRWHRRYVYLSSTHIALPRRLNRGFLPYQTVPTGVLLHNKFLPDIVDRSVMEKHRAEHFTEGENYRGYYEALENNPDLWHPGSVRYEGWQQLVDLGLMADP